MLGLRRPGPGGLAGLERERERHSPDQTAGELSTSKLSYREKKAFRVVGRRHAREKRLFKWVGGGRVKSKARKAFGSKTVGLNLSDHSRIQQ